MTQSDEGIHTFPKFINTKLNIIVRREFEIAYYDDIVQYVNHNDAGNM